MQKTPMLADALDQVEIFKDRIGLEASSSLIDAAADEDSGVAVAQAQLAQVRIDARERAGCRGLAVEQQVEVAAGHVRVGERLADAGSGILRRDGVGMHEPQ